MTISTVRFGQQIVQPGDSKPRPGHARRILSQLLGGEDRVTPNIMARSKGSSDLTSSATVGKRLALNV